MRIFLTPGEKEALLDLVNYVAEHGAFRPRKRGTVNVTIIDNETECDVIGIPVKIRYRERRVWNGRAYFTTRAGNCVIAPTWKVAGSDTLFSDAWLERGRSDPGRFRRELAMFKLTVAE